MTECLKYKAGGSGKEKDYITREGVFCHMWMNTKLTEGHKEYICEHYSQIPELYRCIKEFREVFVKRNAPMLYLFIERYKVRDIKAIKSFAKGLERDIDAIEIIVMDLSKGQTAG